MEISRIELLFIFFLFKKIKANIPQDIVQSGEHIKKKKWRTKTLNIFTDYQI